MADGLTNREVGDAYAQYGHLVLRRCRLLLREDALAEDALQEVFVKLIRWGESFRKTDAPVRWLYRTSDRVCSCASSSDRNRRDRWLYRTSDRVCFDLMKKRRNKSDFDELDPELPAPPGVSHETLDAITRFLRTLGEKDRTIAVLSYVDGLSQGEIATETGWSRQTINKKLKSIRTKAEKFGAVHA